MHDRFLPNFQDFLKPHPKTTEQPNFYPKISNKSAELTFW